MKCLLVEDDPVLSRMLFRVMCQMGHDVAVAETLCRARQALDGQPFDTLLCDYALPDGTAFDLCDAAFCLDPVPRIVVMTGSLTFPASAAVVQAMGVAQVLPKPFDRRDLADALGPAHRAA
ncbi:MAG: response regulator [Pseudomonadota bacterium]